jgi:uncharacterized protein (DUF362 family)
MNRWITFAALGFLMLVMASAGAAPTTNTTTKTRVIAVTDSRAVTDGSCVRAMVASGIMALAGPRDEAAAWRAFVGSNDVVGIKINTQAAPLFATHRAVVDAIVDGLCSVGVPSENIYIFDRDPDKMRAAGFAKPGTTPRVKEVGVIGETGWDAEAVYENKLVGKLIWSDLLFRRSDQEISTRSHLPKLVSRTITKLINAPALQSHDNCGLCGCLHNLSLAMVDNTRRFDLHNQNGDPAIAEICAMPALRRKLVLNVMDALVAGYAGGPAFRPQYSWQPGTLYFSLDPVALDTVCLQQIEEKRKAANVTQLGERGGHIISATRLGLGECDPKRIELIERTR